MMHANLKSAPFTCMVLAHFVNIGRYHFMDQGAHFYCCDFQVHTPRDRHWHGDCPVTESERQRFADELIAACTIKGLDAIAVTEHHDLAFLPYIRRAAANEKDSAGQILEKSRQIVVFPGIELAIALPCQAILLFDPETDGVALERALAALGY